MSDNWWVCEFNRWLSFVLVCWQVLWAKANHLFTLSHEHRSVKISLTYLIHVLIAYQIHPHGCFTATWNSKPQSPLIIIPSFPPFPLLSCIGRQTVPLNHQGSPNTAHLLSHSSGGSIQFSSVAQLWPTLCDPKNRNTPGLPVHHQLVEFTQTHVHRLGDAIQASHPLLSPSPPAFNLSQHLSLFEWVSSLHLTRWPNGESNGIPLQYSCLGNPMDGRPGGL